MRTASFAPLLFSLLLAGCSGTGTAAPQLLASLPETGPDKGHTIETRFAPPAGFHRVPAPAGSFGAYLRTLPLKPAGSPVHYYNGGTKGNDVHAAVVDMEVGTRDLQQCADAVMRLRAEWLYARGRYDDISFRFSDGFAANYKRWRDGYRVGVKGNHSFWQKTAAPSAAYADFRRYLDVVFMYAGTLTLSKQLVARPVQELAIGDVFIRGGSPGHAVIVVDVAINDRGERRFLLAQSYMPAQDIHVLKNPNSRDGSAWYALPPGNALETPEWDFKTSELKTWPE